MDPQPISMVSNPNTYSERLGRLFYNDYSNSLNYEGLLFVFVPFIVFVIVFFLIRQHSNNKKVPSIYAFIVSILYLIYLFALLPKLMYVI
jgi:hypothetical protein